MGICTSCLGLDRRSSQDAEESDPLLVDSQTAAYGTSGTTESSPPPPDEEDLRREREVLARITAEAAENMIDISHASAADLTQYHDHDHHHHHHQDGEAGAQRDDTQQVEADADADESAWLQSLAMDEEALEIKALRPGRTLVLDVASLRMENGGGGGGGGGGGEKKNVVRAGPRWPG